MVILMQLLMLLMLLPLATTTMLIIIINVLIGWLISSLIIQSIRECIHGSVPYLCHCSSNLSISPSLNWTTNKFINQLMDQFFNVMLVVVVMTMTMTTMMMMMLMMMMTKTPKRCEDKKYPTK